MLIEYKKLNGRYVVKIVNYTRFTTDLSTCVSISTRSDIIMLIRRDKVL